MADTIKATPRNQTLGSLVNAYDKTLGPLLNKYEVLPQIPLIGGMTLGDLGANSIRNVANEMSYGNYQPVRNARNIQTMTIDPATLDVATMLPLGGVAAKIGKPLAKAVGRGAAERMARHIDSVGLNQYIIPPEGNLNFTTRLDEQIKGPETQTVYDLLKQVQGKPGVTKEGLKQLAAMYPDSAAKVTKKEFAESIPASQYGKVDLEADFDDMYENYFNEAMENLDPVTTYYNLGLPQAVHNDFDRVVSNEINFSDLDPEIQELFKERFGLAGEVSDSQAYSRLGDIYMDQQQEELADYARQAAENAGDQSSYAYKSFQRLVPKDDPGYFEFGVTHPDQTGQYKHYSSNTMPEGLIGHVRGSHVGEPTVIEGGFEVPANSYVIEEIQSDAQKGSDQVGPLHQVHGTLFKSAIQDAAEKGADYVYLPTSNPIAAVRGRRGEDYSSIYDQAVIKEGLDPLRKIPGIEIKPINQKILNGMLEFDELPMYHEIKLSPEAREHILLGPGQSIPGYAAGGLVASDYDEESISQMADDLLGYGNRVTGEAKGKGALGEIRMPDGRDVMTEYSINVDGREMPSIVEGMHPADVNYIRETGIVPEDAIATAIRSANKREAQGKSAFYAKGGAVKDPFADMSYMDKWKLLYEGGKKRFGKYYNEANQHGEYPDDLLGRLKTKYVEPLGNSRENRTPLDVAINYGGGYDFGARNTVAPEDARQMAKAYQLMDYMTSFRKKEVQDAIHDYYENMEGVEAGIAGRSKGRMPESAIEEASKKYGLSKATAAPVYSEKGYAQGGLVYNDEEINNLANQLLGA